MDTGSNIDDVLALGRRLAEHFEGHDTIRHWMAHHLAYLIVAADDQSATLEQRQEIVELILKIWSFRSYFPDGSPLQGFSTVFSALEEIGDRSPWRLGRLVGPELVDSAVANAELVAHAVELENLTRETVTSLLCLAAERAQDSNEAWLKMADKVADNVETRVIRALQRRRRRDPRLILKDPASEDDAMDVLLFGPESDQPYTTSDAKQHSSSSRLDNEVRQPTNTPQESAVAVYHVTRLREMATLLNRVADELSTSGEDHAGSADRGHFEGTDKKPGPA